MKIDYRFVGQGTVAPDPVGKDELWLDVGGRAALQVVDHHGGDTSAWCALELVAQRSRQLISEPLADHALVTLVLHHGPGLDGTASAWLARAVLEDGDLPGPPHAIAAIVQAVAENDQGFVRTDDPASCWSIVVRLSVATQTEMSDDLAQVRVGCALLDRTLEGLRQGLSLAQVARTLLTPTVRAVISHAERDYREDLLRSERFQLRLPVRLVEPWVTPQEEAPQDPPGRDEVRWCLTDGLVLRDPSSSLFRELARGDRATSALGQGYGLMVVNRPVDIDVDPPMWRYIISTDPMSGLSLKGLGKVLEQTEEAHEDARSSPLLEGRERVEPGQGRHGYDVRSPWYDGRAHAFTIVDSPQVKIDSRGVCASSLLPSDILEGLWQYGDPHVTAQVEEAVVTLLRPARLDDDWRETWNAPIGFETLCPDLHPELTASGSLPAVRRLKGPWQLSATVTMLEQQLVWCGEDRALWVAICRLEHCPANGAEVSRSVGDLVSGQTIDQAVPKGVKLERSGGFHLVHARLGVAGVALNDERGTTAALAYLLARAQPSTFASRADANQLQALVRANAPDHEVLFVSHHEGAVALSVSATPLEGDPEFQQPENLSALMTLFMTQKLRLELLSELFTRHCSDRHPMRGTRLILDDQWQLIRLDQELSIARVADCVFGQRVYETLVEATRFERQVEDTKSRIETLARHLRDTQAAFFQRIGLWVSVLFAPLALTASIFSGTQLSSQFSQTYVGFLPSQLEAAGWIQFLVVLASLSAVLGGLWLVMRLAYARQGPLIAADHSKNVGVHKTKSRGG